MDAMGKGFTCFHHFGGLVTSEKFWVLLQRQAQALSLMICIFPPSPMENWAIYSDLFTARWEFPPKGSELSKGIRDPNMA